VNKKIIRSDIHSKINGLSPARLSEINQGVTNELKRFFQSRPDLISQIGGAYLPMENEIAADFNELSRLFSLRISYPVLQPDGMQFALSENPKGQIWLDPPYQIVKPAWLLVPGLAFSFKGERLGRGGGYYDRYLEINIPVRIALTYSALICDNIPIEPHDALMDFIITENFCWDVHQQKRI